MSPDLKILTCPESKSFIHSFIQQVFSERLLSSQPKRFDKQKWTLAFSSLFLVTENTQRA